MHIQYLLKDNYCGKKVSIVHNYGQHILQSRTPLS